MEMFEKNVTELFIEWLVWLNVSSTFIPINQDVLASLSRNVHPLVNIYSKLKVKLVKNYICSLVSFCLIVTVYRVMVRDTLFNLNIRMSLCHVCLKFLL